MHFFINGAHFKISSTQLLLLYVLCWAHACIDRWANQLIFSAYSQACMRVTRHAARRCINYTNTIFQWEKVGQRMVGAVILRRTGGRGGRRVQVKRTAMTGSPRCIAPVCRPPYRLEFKCVGVNSLCCGATAQISNSSCTVCDSVWAP
jgi:hypothetical protein